MPTGILNNTHRARQHPAAGGAIINTCFTFTIFIILMHLRKLNKTPTYIINIYSI